MAIGKKNISTYTRFKDWIDHHKVKTIAGWLDVEEATVRYWRAGDCLPRAEQMRAIKELSILQGPKVTYTDMINANLERKGL